MSKKKNYLKFAMIAGAGLLLTGCNTFGTHGAWQPTPMGTTQSGVPVYANHNQAVANQQVTQPQQAAQPMAMPMESAQALMQDINTINQNVDALHQRLQRLERAMIRLDRRLQLIESKELGRMSGTESNQTFSPLAQMEALPTQTPPQAAPYPQGFTPVAQRQQFFAQQPTITSTLQAAPQQVAALHSQNRQMNNSGLPSLSDEKNQAQETNMSVWTITYQAGKIWPDRSQLPASRDVVDALRNSSPNAIFARGTLPNSRQFRERVRALSRYLSKVSDIENVAISTMGADHLAPDTIEIFVTR